MNSKQMTHPDRAGQFQTSVWIGCLACYNAGHLVGDGYATRVAVTITPSDLHQRAGRAYRNDHEELWVLDHENLPITGECSTQLATAWGNLLDDLDDWEREPFIAWVRNTGTSECDIDDLPAIQDFRDAYADQWDTFRDYAADLLDETGGLESIPEALRAHFDLEAYSRDLAYDFDVIPADDGTVWVFALS